MARRKKAPHGAKSQAIRDYLAAHKGAMPAEVVGALKEQGLVVSSQMVSTVKAWMGTTKRRKRKVATRAAETIGNGRGVTIADLLKAKKLVKDLGMERAKEAIDVLARLA